MTRASEAARAPAPHYLEHRKRLRARFLTAPDVLEDYEVLELLLFAVDRRGDTKPLAKSLIARFGDLAGVLNASADELKAVKGIGEAALAHFAAVRVASVRLLAARTRKRPVIAGWSELLDYLRAAMGHESVERFRILFLDRQNALIADEVQQHGTIDQAPVYPREVARRALALHASAVILVHNHPSGNVTPSRADIEMTKAVGRALDAVGVTLHDHLVIGREEHASFRALGLF